MSNQDKMAVRREVRGFTFNEPAVPLPYYFGFWIFTRYVCHCGSKFKTEEAYAHHYYKEHTDETD